MLTRFTLGLKNDETGLGIVNKINQLITECPKEHYIAPFRKLDGRLELVLDELL